MELKQLFDLARAERKKERKRSAEKEITKEALRKYLRYFFYATAQSLVLSLSLSRFVH